MTLTRSQTTTAKKKSRKAARSRKLRSADAAKVGPGYDGQRDIHSGLVPDPEKHGYERVVLLNARESGIAQMVARGQLSGQQARAAQRFEAIHSGLNASPNQAVDTTRPVIDVSARACAISDTVLNAGLEMSRCVGRLGKIEFAVVTMIAGEGMTIKQAAYRMSGRSSKRAATIMGRAFRAALDKLAVMWGLTGGSKAGA